MVRSVEQPGGTRAILEIYRARLIDAEQNRPHYASPISCPVLAVGAQAYLGDQVYKQLTHVTSDVRSVVIADSGHNIALEKPAELTTSRSKRSFPERQPLSRRCLPSGQGRYWRSVARWLARNSTAFGTASSRFARFASPCPSSS